jgi:hypothetical protein
VRRVVVGFSGGVISEAPECSWCTSKAVRNCPHCGLDLCAECSPVHDDGMCRPSEDRAVAAAFETCRRWVSGA